MIESRAPPEPPSTTTSGMFSASSISPRVCARMCDSERPKTCTSEAPQLGRSHSRTRFPPSASASASGRTPGKSLLNRPPGVRTTTSPSSGPRNSWTTMPPLTSTSATAGLELVEPTGVLAVDLGLRLPRQRRHLLLHALERARVEAGRVREVGLEQDPVLADGLDELRQPVAVVLEPEGRVDVALEVLRRRLLQSREVCLRVLVHLVVESLEDERDPADTALDGDRLQGWVPVEDAGQDEVGDDPRVADEQQRAADGQFRGLLLRCPCVVAVEGHRGDARADVEVHRQLEVGAHLPERVPLATGEVRCAQVL